MKVGTAMKMAAAIFVLALFQGANSRRLLGSEKCTWGPSYWCSGLSQSSRCQATHHCIDKVWNANPYPEDDDEVCTICKNMVKEARDTLQSNETQEELKEVFEGSCALIPIKVIRNECDKLADEFVPELVETLSSEMNPDTVCTVAGLCNSVRIDKMLDNLGHHRKPKSDCDICQEESRKLSAQIKNADKGDVLDKLFEMCGYAGSYSDACRAMVLQDFDDIYDVLTHLDDGLCDLSGMCPSNGNTFSVAKNGDIQCEFCEKVIKHWIDTWTSNTTENEFKEVLEALCHKMKPERVQHCLHIVDDYYIPWFNYILHELNPKSACQLMGLCSQELLASNNAPITLLLKEQPLETTQPTNRLIGGYFAPQTATVLEKPGCVICEYVISELQTVLGQNKTEAEIEKALDNICNYMPSSVEGQCTNLVETYGPAIIEIISRGVNPKDVCTMMQLCNKAEEGQLLGLPADNPVVEIKKKDDNCALCQYAMKTLYQVLENKDTEDEVKNALETLCRFMPASIEDKCEEYIDAYAEKIIEFVMKSMTPDEICGELGLCQTKKSTLVLTEKDSKCVLCEYIMSTLDQLIANKTSEDEIRAELDKVCQYLPSTIRNQCTNFVDQYSDMIIDFLTHQITPEQICQQIGLCAGLDAEYNDEQLQMVQQVDEIIEEDESEPRPYCTLCEYAIGEVDKMITDKQNEAEIKNVLDRICYELSAPIQKECLNMVNRYTDEIIDMFVAEYTPQEVCAELGLCNEVQEQEQMEENVIKKFVDENDSLCELCEYAMHILGTKILTNQTMDMAEHAVEMICSYMPGTIADKCTDFVQEYGDEIIDLIVHAEMNPDQTCSAMTLCKSAYTTWDASPLGGHRCTWGPAFWCQSRVHAKACGTTRHCETNVWNNN